MSKGGCKTVPTNQPIRNMTPIIRIATWNIRTMLLGGAGAGGLSAELRKTAVIDYELSKLNIDVAALQETRLPGAASLREKNYTFFWQGLRDDQPRWHGVGFAIKNSLLNCITTPVGKSERLMYVRLHAASGYVNLINAYAPTLMARHEVKDIFYEELHTLVSSFPNREQMYVLGDFNARTGTDYDSWPGCIGRYGVGRMNENGQRLLEFCAVEGLAVTNTFFDGNHRRRVSWRHPRSGHWHQLDFVLTRRVNLNGCRITRAYHSADCNTDHALVLSKIRLKPKSALRSATLSARKKINIEATNQIEARDSFNTTFIERFESLPVSQDVDEQWANLRDCIYNTAVEVYGTERASNKDWVEKNAAVLLPLIEEKRKAKLIHNHSPNQQTLQRVKQTRNEVQRVSRVCANRYWTELCVKIQEARNEGNLKEHFSLLQAALGPRISSIAPLKNKEGELIIDRGQQLERWREHYSELYSREALTAVHPELEQSLQSLPVLMELDAAPSVEELDQAIASLPNGKTPGSDGINGEVLRVNKAVLLQPLYDLLKQCWEQGVVPSEMKNSIMVTIYKNKGDRGLCDNFRGISLLEVAGKAFGKVILRRLRILAERVLPETQCGFRAERSTADMLFTLRQMQEKCREQRMPLYIAFVDLAKAFDTVCRPALYMVLESIGCPPKLLKMIEAFHEDMTSSVQYDGSRSEPFPVSNGVKQGCVLAPTLFGIYFAALLEFAFEASQEGIFVRTRLDGSLFDISRLRSRALTREVLVRDLLFADDAALVAHSEGTLQILLDRLSRACDVFSLNISVEKTKIMTQNAPTIPEIRLNNDVLSNESRFRYLGSVVTESLDLEDELSARIGKASASFGKLTKRAWENNKLTVKTKVLIFQACVLSTLLYGSESWTLYSRQEKRLNGFYMRCLRRILHINWQDRITNNEVLRRVGLPSLFETLRVSRLRWLGHVYRMDDARLPKSVLYGELSEGTRPVGRPKLRFKDSCKRALEDFGVPICNWEQVAVNRSCWRAAVNEGQQQFGIDRQRRDEERRHRRHQAERRDDVGDPAFPCAYCGRLCRANIGRISHERACSHRPPNN